MARMKRTAFTVLELLIVIADIAVSRDGVSVGAVDRPACATRLRKGQRA